VAPKLTVNDPAVHGTGLRGGPGGCAIAGILCRQGLATGRAEARLPDWTLAPAAILYAVYATTLQADTRVQRFVEFPRSEYSTGTRIRAARLRHSLRRGLPEEA